MGDLPDWITAQANQGSVLFNGTKGMGASYQADVTNNQSLYVRLDGSVAATPLVVEIVWYTDSTLATPTQTQYFTAVANPSGGNDLVIETPVYSGYVLILNQSPQVVTLTVIGTGRSVSDPKVLESTYPARPFGFTGNLVNAVGVQLTPLDGASNDFKSNGQTYITLFSNTAGLLYCQYIGADGAVHLIQMLVAVVNANAIVTAALAQGGVNLFFIPSASNAAGNVAVTLVASQL